MAAKRTTLIPGRNAKLGGGRTKGSSSARNHPLIAALTGKPTVKRKKRKSSMVHAPSVLMNLPKKRPKR